MATLSTANSYTALIGGLLAAAVAYVSLGGPLVATRGYVTAKLRPVECDLLKVRRHANEIDLYQWQRDNPTPGQAAQEQIDQLKATIAAIDRQSQEECE